MDLTEWLFMDILVERNLRNFYYLAMALISLLAIYIAKRTRLVRFSLLLWLFSGTICLLWETYLFVTGSRSYEYYAIVELLYHALTEAGPGLIIMTIGAHYMGIIDLSRFREGEE